MVLTGPEKSFEVPSYLHPKSINNHGNYIISLGRLCEWMSEKAEDLGVDILPATAGNSLIFNDDGSIAGVITGDMGIGKDGEEKESFEPGIEIRARQTIFTEGCRGSLTERLKKNFDLEKDSVSVQHYGIGLKEVWEVDEDNEHFSPGLV